MLLCLFVFLIKELMHTQTETACFITSWSLRLSPTGATGVSTVTPATLPPTPDTIPSRFIMPSCIDGVCCESLILICTPEWIVQLILVIDSCNPVGFLLMCMIKSCSRFDYLLTLIIKSLFTEPIFDITRSAWEIWTCMVFEQSFNNINSYLAAVSESFISILLFSDFSIIVKIVFLYLQCLKLNTGYNRN